MNNDNIVKIGTALKWRNTYDPTKKYYRENIITAGGSVFRCKVLQAQGIPPVAEIDELGHIGFINTDIWDVVVDMSYYYNFVIDSKIFTQETLDYVKMMQKEYVQDLVDALAETHNSDFLLLKKFIQNNRSRIRYGFKRCQELQGENKTAHDEFAEKIKWLEERNQQLFDILNNSSGYGYGLWDNDALWDNEALWVNGYLVGGGCNCGGDGSANLTDHEQRITQLEDLVKNLIDRADNQDAIIAKQQKQIDQLVEYIDSIKVYVEYYDPETETVAIGGLYVEAYNSDTETVALGRSKSNNYDPDTDTVIL